MVNVIKGDRVQIWHDLDRDGESAIGIVTQVRDNGIIRAVIEDEDHELHKLDDGETVRELTVSPDLYEVIG